MRRRSTIIVFFAGAGLGAGVAATFVMGLARGPVAIIATIAVAGAVRGSARGREIGYGMLACAASKWPPRSDHCLWCPAVTGYPASERIGV
jgi:hypothetical protein